MSETTNVVRGTIRPDGTLELAEPLTLPAGEVEVTVRPLATERTGENWFECLERIRDKREAAGYPFRTKEEIDADLEADRDWGEDRLEEARGQGETGPPSPPSRNGKSMIQPLPRDPRTETLWQYMQRTRAELEAAGHPFRTKEEIDADIEAGRDWNEEKHDAISGKAEGYGPYLARIRDRREAEGFPFRTKEEIDAEMAELRSWPDRSGDIERKDNQESGDSQPRC